MTDFDFRSARGPSPPAVQVGASGSKDSNFGEERGGGPKGESDSCWKCRQQEKRNSQGTPIQGGSWRKEETKVSKKNVFEQN